LQVAHNQLFRVHSDHQGMEPLSLAVRAAPERFLAVPLRGAGNPSGGMGVGGMGEVVQRPPEDAAALGSGGPDPHLVDHRAGDESPRVHVYLFGLPRRDDPGLQALPSASEV